MEIKMKKQRPRSKWGSQLGFILATSGAAIGLGNIQRFPYITAQCGGAAFVMIYLVCVAVLGLPMILTEFALGRHTHKNPVCAIEDLKGKKSPWKLVGALGILTAFFILSYYTVVASWTFGFTIQMMTGHEITLENYASNPFYVLSGMLIFMLLVIYIVSKGITKGIERYSKILMPILFFILVILIIRSLTLPNCMEGLTFYLKPDFSSLNLKIFLYALSQAFFSLCVGEAVLITYGSYANNEEDLVSSATYIAAFDTLVAIMSGLVIFPALFAFGHQPDQGVGLTFKILPVVFKAMPFGMLFGSAFFILLGFAALTTSIALLEIPVAYLIDSRHWSRKKAVWTVGGAALLLGIPSGLSKGANNFLSTLHFNFIDQTSFYDIMDFTWGSLGMVVGGLLLAIFVGWIWGADQALRELKKGRSKFTVLGKAWKFIIKYLAPVIISIILLSLFI
ncbi:MAG: sodium-dependent transporter [Chlamydiota bacterium]